MCGIAGIVHWDKKPIDISVLEKMGDSIQHRGPDDDGMQVGPGLGFSTPSFKYH